MPDTSHAKTVVIFILFIRHRQSILKFRTLAAPVFQMKQDHFPISSNLMLEVMACLFFAMVFFAALTSAVSVLEAVVSSVMDQFQMSRITAAITETIIAAILGVVVCFGYNLFYFELPLPNGATAQILDLMDYVSNNVLMPIVAIATCVLIGWVVKPSFTIQEFEKNGIPMGRKRLFTVMIRYITPVLLFLLFLKAIGLLNI